MQTTLRDNFQYRVTMQRINVQLSVLLVVFFSVQCHGQLLAEGESCTVRVRNPERCADPESMTENVEPVEEGFG